jgi:hypothetical protein
MKILLGNSKKFALISSEDGNQINEYKWYLGKSGYAQSVKRIEGKRYLFKMHRLIMKVINPKILVHHINGNRLDNRRFNLCLMLRPEHSKLPKLKRRKKILFCPHCGKRVF